MGMDISGGMLIGAHGDKLSVPEDSDLAFHEWADENGLESYAMHYDASQSYTYYGFEISDIKVSEVDSKWLQEIRKKADEFEKITGVTATLIGTQSVYETKPAPLPKVA